MFVFSCVFYIYYINGVFYDRLFRDDGSFYIVEFFNGEFLELQGGMKQVDIVINGEYLEGSFMKCEGINAFFYQQSYEQSICEQCKGNFQDDCSLFLRIENNYL